MRKKLLLFFFLFFLLINNNCFAAINIEVPLFNIPNPTLPQYIWFFFQLAMAAGGILAVLSLVFSGIQFIYSSGSPEGIGEAKKRAKSAILGLILLLSSFIIVTTINPKLESLGPTEGLNPVGAFFFANVGVADKPAPMQMENLDVIKQEYKGIGWKDHCDPENPNAVYVIYLYIDYNFKNLGWVSRKKCDTIIVGIGEANSYLIVKETPGVYFYDGDGCQPYWESNTFPILHTQSIPEDIGMGGKNVRSIRIVNGPDPIKGPFFGLIYFNSTDYRTGESSYGFQNFQSSHYLSEEQKADNNSYCFSGTDIGYGGTKNLPSKGVSWVIYKTVSLYQDGMFWDFDSAGSGVTLYTDVSWLGGSRDVSWPPSQENDSWIIELSKWKVAYPANTTISDENQKICEYFYPDKACLKSFEIKGNYLVILLSKEDSYKREYNQTIKAQAFPISPRLLDSYGDRRQGFSVERGTPELKTDYIGDKSAYFMEIIPLAERLR